MPFPLDWKLEEAKLRGSRRTPHLTLGGRQEVGQGDASSVGMEIRRPRLRHWAEPQAVWTGQRLCTCHGFNFSKAISKTKGQITLSNL